MAEKSGVGQERNKRRKRNQEKAKKFEMRERVGRAGIGRKLVGTGRVEIERVRLGA